MHRISNWCMPSPWMFMINQVTIYHNPLIVRTAKTASGRFRRETGKTGNKPPENPPETRRLCFYGMHEYARKCIARKFTPFSRGKSCFRCSSYPKTVNGDAIYCVAVRRCRHSRKPRISTIRNRVRRRPAITLWQVAGRLTTRFTGDSTRDLTLESPRS